MKTKAHILYDDPDATEEDVYVDTVGELINHVYEGIRTLYPLASGTRMGIISLKLVTGGLNLTTIDPGTPLSDVYFGSRVSIYVFTTPKLWPLDLIDWVNSVSRDVANISPLKPVATLPSGDFGTFHKNWELYSQEWQARVLEGLETPTSGPIGVKYEPGQQVGALFYSIPWLSILADVAGMTLEDALELLATVQDFRKDPYARDFIYMAFGNVTGKSSQGDTVTVQDLTSLGQQWYRLYRSEVAPYLDH